MGDSHYYPQFIDALRAQLMEVLAVEIGTILFDGPEIFARRRKLQRRATDPEHKRLADAAMKRLYEDADIYLWLPYRYGPRVPYYGYGAGVLRIALGDNWESGGANRSSLEAWFWFTDATITAADTPLVESGRLVLR